MTLDIAIAYDHTTRRLSAGRCNEVIGGTYGDANSTRLVFDITGITDTYTVRCALGSPIHSGHDVEFPEYTLDDNTFIIPGELMSSALHGEIPVQLHFTTAEEEWYSGVPSPRWRCPEFSEWQDRKEPDVLRMHKRALRPCSSVHLQHW